MLFLNHVAIDKRFFPDGTFNLMKFPNDVLSLDEIYDDVPDIAWQYHDISEQVLLYTVTKQLFDMGLKKPRLFMPYVPNARMDRVHQQGREVPTLKFFASFINDLSFKKVFILDPHSDVTPMLLDRVRVIPRDIFFQKAVVKFEPTVTVFPDAGAMKRYHHDGPFLYAEKVRDWKTGKIEGVTIHNPLGLSLGPDTRALISDDISSKGGTFYHVGKALKEMGVGHVGLYVSHCEDSIKDGLLFTEESPVEVVYTTDSIEREYKNDRLVVFSVMDTLY